MVFESESEAVLGERLWAAHGGITSVFWGDCERRGKSVASKLLVPRPLKLFDPSPVGWGGSPYVSLTESIADVIEGLAELGAMRCSLL